MSLALAATAAFAAGLAASAHCLAMCGAISLSLSKASPDGHGFVIAKHVGRVSAYTFAGLIMGAFGQSLLFVGHNGNLRLALQIAFALSWIWLAARLWKPSLRLPFAAKLTTRVWAKLQPWTRALLPASTPLRTFALGALWGFLPCGLSYTMLMIAATQGSALGGAFVMLAFGLATTPALGALDFGAQRFRQRVLAPGLRLLGASCALALAGLSLWIPFKHRGHAHDFAISIALSGDEYCRE